MIAFQKAWKGTSVMILGQQSPKISLVYRVEPSSERAAVVRDEYRLFCLRTGHGNRVASQKCHNLQSGV